MSFLAKLKNCQRRYLTALAILSAQATLGQGIVYEHLPLSNPNGNPNQLPWDSLGTQVGPDLPIVINGQTVCTFSAPIAAGQPSSFVIIPSSTSAVIAVQPNLAGNSLDPTTFPVPLTAGTQIGADAASYSWLGNYLAGDVLTVARESGIIGEPPVTEGYFTGDESAYIGLEFEQNGETYYGWIQAGCPVVGLNVGWVYDYAYETMPNTPIAAGAVPEPGTLGLFALGIVALASLTRKRMLS